MLTSRQWILIVDILLWLRLCCSTQMNSIDGTDDKDLRIFVSDVHIPKTIDAFGWCEWKSDWLYGSTCAYRGARPKPKTHYTMKCKLNAIVVRMGHQISNIPLFWLCNQMDSICHLSSRRTFSEFECIFTVSPRIFRVNWSIHEYF